MQFNTNVKIILKYKLYIKYITYMYFLSRIPFILQTLGSHATKFKKLSKHTKQNSSFTLTTSIISVHLSYIAF